MNTLEQKESEGLVLVVDDDPFFLEILKRFLEKHGYRAALAECGEDALALFARETPVLILLDASMPGMDGFTVCTRIKETPRGKAIPVIMVTGMADQESVSQAFAAGAVEYVTKPINWSVLEHRIHILVTAARHERERLSFLQAMEKSEERYRNLVELSPYAVVVHRRESILYANPAAAALVGAQSSPDLAGLSLNCFVPEPFRLHLVRSLRQMLFSGAPRLQPMEGKLARLDGSLFDAEVVVSLTNYHDQLALQSVVRDITERKRAEEELKLAANVFETSTEGIVISDRNNHILKVNEAFTNITGYTEAEVLGKNPRFISSGRHPKEFYQEMWQSILETGRWRGEIWNRRKGGEVFPEWLSVTAIRDEDGKITRYIALFSDITQRKSAEEKVRYQATHDALTGLPNRSLFQDRLAQHLNQGRRERRKVAVLFIDLDRFKWVNDTLGHAAGDRLLQETAKRLRDCVREADTVARLGGDEFTVILYEGEASRGAETVAAKILDSLAMPYFLEGQEVNISGSIGITLFPDDAMDLETLLKNADSAMYEAKRAGRNAYRFFTPRMNEEANRRMTLEHDLRKATSRDQLLLHYQPILCLAENRYAGAEALLRWRHPQHGLLPPREFLPIAEEAGLMPELADFILQRACDDALGWSAPDGVPLFVTINLSMRLFRDGRCRTLVLDSLERSGFPPSRLILEMRESALLDEMPETAAGIQLLKEMGIRFILDNFGTGYSSLNTLKRFPLDAVKIDGVFVRGAVDAPMDAVFAHAIINLAQSLGLQVIGAGVENERQLEFLQVRHCDYAQGFYLSEPLAPQAFTRWLTDLGQVRRSRGAPPPVRTT